MQTAKGTTTIVTGASRGIGAATAVHLARAGQAVVVNFRHDREAAEQIVRAIVAEGGRAVPVQADVTRDEDVQRLFATAYEQLGPVTGLVNNAGSTVHIADLADTSVDVVREVLDLNLLAVILCARRAAQTMSTARGGAGGAIVNISSAAATLGSAHEYVHYAAAKAGVEALTVGLARELAREGIRVNAVAPGIVRTGIHASAGDPGRAERLADRIPLGRAGQPQEVAPAIGWLLSADSSYVTGAVLRVAGGL
ncbi:MAG: SDR family oxidoreductase [Pseudonocardiales bacterium]